MTFNLINNLYLISGIVIVVLATYFYKISRDFKSSKRLVLFQEHFTLLILSVIGTTILMLGYNHYSMPFVRHPTTESNSLFFNHPITSGLSTLVALANL